MISGLNHNTLSVTELERSFRFYAEVVGLRPVARWYKGAYLLAGEAWVCISLDSNTRSGPLPQYSHLAFTVEQSRFSDMVESLRAAGAVSWQENHSHGDSFYFLDPDGHKLEIHTSDLAAGLASLRRNPPKDLILFRNGLLKMGRDESASRTWSWALGQPNTGCVRVSLPYFPSRIVDRMNRRDCLRSGGLLSMGSFLRPKALLADITLSMTKPLSQNVRKRTLSTSVLDIAFEDSGSESGSPVVLLHGFPYDVRQYDQVRDELVEEGHRVLVPYLRGYGPTRYRNQQIPRSGQQAALGKDVIDFLDALQIRQAVLVGYDWGCRAACIAAALWPERVHGLLSSNGYAIQDIAKNAHEPAPPATAYRRWYVSYFNTEIGRVGLEQNRHDFCKLLWKLWSPTWDFADEDYEQTAQSFENPDFVSTVIQEYRHRYANAPGDPAYAEIEARLAQQPAITVPTIVLAGGNDGVEPPATPDLHRKLFAGRYERQILPQVGHCVPAEAPHAVVAAVKELLRTA